MLPRPKGRGFRLACRPSSAPRDAELLLRRPPNGVASTACTPVASTGVEHLGSVHVGVRAVPARDALEFALAPAARRIDDTAFGARLRAVRRRNLDHRAAVRHDLTCAQTLRGTSASHGSSARRAVRSLIGSNAVGYRAWSMRPASDFRAGRHYLPKVALSRLVNSLEGVSARRVRARRFPEVTSVCAARRSGARATARSRAAVRPWRS
jgi:hypothetical protein